MQRCNSIKNLA